MILSCTGSAGMAADRAWQDRATSTWCVCLLGREGRMIDEKWYSAAAAHCHRPFFCPTDFCAAARAHLAAVGQSCSALCYGITVSWRGREGEKESIWDGPSAFSKSWTSSWGGEFSSDYTAQIGAINYWWHWSSLMHISIFCWFHVAYVMIVCWIFDGLPTTLKLINWF